MTEGTAIHQSTTIPTPEQEREQRIEKWLSKIGYDSSVGDVLAFADLDDGSVEVVATLAGRGCKRKVFA